jgi:hypothetical protein
VAPRLCGVLARIRIRDPQCRAAGLRGERVDRKAELRRDDLDTATREHLRELHQQFVRTVAEQDLRGHHAVVRSQCVFQVAAHGVRVTMRVGEARACDV